MSPDRSFHRWRPHPWHGLPVGPEPPRVVHAYVEITPFDPVKYEVDKESGYLRVDRPQRTSSNPPALYGFVPRTYCGARVGALMPGAQDGDHDPLDVCVLSERPITKAEVIADVRVVGGLPMLDHGAADDKLIAVVATDHVWSDVRDVAELPPVLVERLRHYFLTYKLTPAEILSREVRGAAHVALGATYGVEHALRVVRAAMEDYAEEFGAG